MTCCQVVALLLLSFLPSAAAGDPVPALIPQSTLQLTKGQFLSQPVLELTTCCDDTCTWWEAALVPQDFQEYLSYETVYLNGTCILTTVEMSPWASGAERRWQRRCVRHKWQIYGADRRFSISGNHFLMNCPFSATVNISTGCTGMLVSVQHVLTAAHCIHDSKDCVKGAKKIKVGFLMLVQSAGNGTGTGTLAMHWAQVQRMLDPGPQLSQHGLRLRPFGAAQATQVPAHEADGSSGSGGDGWEEESFLGV